MDLRSYAGMWLAIITRRRGNRVSQFTLEILQAINDWQRGGDHKQKVKRGAKLKQASQALDSRFRTCTITCYRQEAHEKDRVWQLLADEKLSETIAAWTTDLATAKHLKGGVPPLGLQGVIFEIVPPAGSVILNLKEVYNAAEFHSEIAAQKSKIVGIGDGIEKYGSSQHEVILELGKLTPNQIFSYGGYASDRVTLAQEIFGRKPTAQDLLDFDALCAKANISQAGDWWLGPNGTKNVLARVEPQVSKLKALKAAQNSV